MESIALYLFKSVVWLTVFAGIYFFFLRNERFFLLNRIFLLTGLTGALLFPLITLRYVVTVPMVNGAALVESATMVGVEHAGITLPTWQSGLWMVFIAGVFYFLTRLVVQSFRIYRIIRQSNHEILGNIKVVKTDVFPASFSFFSYVFVSPSTPEPARREIVTHEAEHIRQRHWVDLIMAELLCMVQWFNPMAWFYSHLIRQNHEYLADQMALRKSEDPAIYKAVLLNQLLGGEVLRLGHLFSYSLNKKRFTMMKNTSIPTIQKLKPLLILPAMALVFYAFALPEYQYTPASEPLHAQSDVKQEDPPKTKNKEVAETTEIEIIEENGQTKVNKTVVVVKTDNETPEAKVRHIVIASDTTFVFAGEEPKHSSFEETDGSEQKHKTIIVGKTTNLDELVLLDGEEISSEQLASLAPEQIQSINVIKGKGATEKYGSKGAGGVVEITSQEPQKPKEKEVFVVVEVMPEFPGGHEAMSTYISENIKYPPTAMEKGIQGKVYITFVVSETGVVENARVIRGVEASLDAEALRVINSMPKWTPGRQTGKDVAVSFTVPIKFALAKKETPVK